VLSHFDITHFSLFALSCPHKHGDVMLCSLYWPWCISSVTAHQIGLAVAMRDICRRSKCCSSSGRRCFPRHASHFDNVRQQLACCLLAAGWAVSARRSAKIRWHHCCRHHSSTSWPFC